ncbi:MAG: hypothetical protein WCH40_05720, partial [Verrucomicrobiales bacterium]
RPLQHREPENHLLLHTLLFFLLSVEFGGTLQTDADHSSRNLLASRYSCDPDSESIPKALSPTQAP